MCKPDLQIFVRVCEEENVNPKECWFVDDHEKNRQTSKIMGMFVVAFDRPATLAEAAKSINSFREQLQTLGILQ